MPVLNTGMTNVAGDFCSHIETASQAVPAVMSQVHRRLMRTRLKVGGHAAEDQTNKFKLPAHK